MDIFSNLSPKQACFCNEYFKDFNATKAALRAGYSPTTALNGKLMTLPKIKYHLQQRGAEAAEQAMVSRQMVLAELKKIAFASVGDFFGADGSLKPIQDVKEDTKAALWNYTVTQGKDGSTTIKIRMSNKLAALEKIAKHIKFYDGPKHDVTHSAIDMEQLEEDDRYDDDTMAPKAVTQKNDDDYLIPTEGEINSWIKDAYEQAVVETERRLRLEYEQKLLVTTPTTAVGTELSVGTPTTGTDGGSQKAEVGGQKVEKKVEKNTDKYHPGEQMTLVRTKNHGIKYVPLREVKKWDGF